MIIGPPPKFHGTRDILAPLPATRSRRENTIYQGDECDTRYLAEQWCYDCNRPARRIGPGGACSWGELLTIDELLDAPP